MLETFVQKIEVLVKTGTLYYAFPLHGLALPPPAYLESTPGAVRYKGQHISTACGDLLMPANGDLNSEEKPYLEVILYCVEIELRP